MSVCCHGKRSLQNEGQSRLQKEASKALGAESRALYTSLYPLVHTCAKCNGKNKRCEEEAVAVHLVRESELSLVIVGLLIGIVHLEHGTAFNLRHRQLLEHSRRVRQRVHLVVWRLDLHKCVLLMSLLHSFPHVRQR